MSDIFSGPRRLRPRRPKPRLWLMLTLCVIGGVLGSSLGAYGTYFWFTSGVPFSEMPTTGVVYGISMIVLATALPVSVCFGILAARGRNRLGGWLLLAFPSLVFVLNVFDWSFAGGIASDLLPLFLAALLAGLSGPRRSWLLATSTIVLWAGFFVLGHAPDFIQGRFEKAVSKGGHRAAERCLSWGADPEPENSNTPPLMIAVQNGDLKMVRILIDHGASPYGAVGFGESPMMRAIDTGQTPITVAMLENLHLVPRPEEPDEPSLD